MAQKREGLGSPTIMSRDLAAEHGADYVWLAAFAIDVDRLRELAEEDGEAGPFGWEVFLTEAYLIAHFDPTREDHRRLLEDTCVHILELGRGEPVLGAQIPFAIYDAVVRGVWPREMLEMLATWKAEPKELVKELAPLWQEADDQLIGLSLASLDATIDPPLAPTTKDALMAIVGAASRGKSQ